MLALNILLEYGVKHYLNNNKKIRPINRLDKDTCGIVIVAKDEDYALSTTQNSNNRGQAEVEKNTSNNTIAFGDDVQVLTLHAGKDEGTFALYAANYLSDGVKKNGYLYAASTTANHLKTRNYRKFYFKRSQKIWRR